jgi:ribosomal protein S19
MSRSNWKTPVINNTFLSSIFLENKYKIRSKKILFRNFCIPNLFCEAVVFVHNGKKFNKFFISRDRVGFKFGDFSFSRTYTKFVLKKKILLKKKKK